MPGVVVRRAQNATPRAYELSISQISARGTAVKVAALLAEQTAAMTAAERGVGSEAGGHMATALELSRLLGRLLALGPARSRVARSPPTLRCLVAVLADLKSLVTTASAESRECASSLQEHLAAIAADEPASRAAVVRECARVVNVATVEAKTALPRSRVRRYGASLLPLSSRHKSCRLLRWSPMFSLCSPSHPRRRSLFAAAWAARHTRRVNTALCSCVM